MKYLKFILKRCIYSFALLYGFNKLGVNFNIIIPFNYISIGIISLLGIPSLIALAFLYTFLF